MLCDPNGLFLFCTSHIPYHAALMANISYNNYRLPTPEDFTGAITAFHRLQETYQLPPSALASGKLGKAPSLSMSGMERHHI